MGLLKLQSVCKDYLWGGTRLITEYGKQYNGDKIAESWELSCHPDGLSKIAQGEDQGKTLAQYIQEKGKKVLGSNCEKFEDFPILIKLIDAEKNLSIQVHPDDQYAREKENEFGKTEMWYIVDCKKDSYLYYGFSKDISKQEMKERIENNTLLEVLNKVPVQKGDVFFIEAGTIHAIGKGILIAEIQQNSNSTYRVYDYGRVDQNGNKRELHVEKALDVTDTKRKEKSVTALPHIAQCKYFTVDKVYLDNESMKKMSGCVTEKTFISILILEGNGWIQNGKDRFEFTKGDSFFIPAGMGEYEIEGYCQALITTVKE